MIPFILHILFFIESSVFLFRGNDNAPTCKPQPDLLYYSRNLKPFCFALLFFTCIYKNMYFQRGISEIYAV